MAGPTRGRVAGSSPDDVAAASGWTLHRGRGLWLRNSKGGGRGSGARYASTDGATTQQPPGVLDFARLWLDRAKLAGLHHPADTTSRLRDESGGWRFAPVHR